MRARARTLLCVFLLPTRAFVIAISQLNISSAKIARAHANRELSLVAAVRPNLTALLEHKHASAKEKNDRKYAHKIARALLNVSARLYLR